MYWMIIVDSSSRQVAVCIEIPILGQMWYFFPNAGNACRIARELDDSIPPKEATSVTGDTEVFNPQSKK
jgi:hypothetical protein